MYEIPGRINKLNFTHLSPILRAVRVGLKIHTQYIALSGFPQKIYGNDAYNVNRNPEIRYSCMFLTKIQV